MTTKRSLETKPAVTLTKADLAERLHAVLGFNKSEAKELIDTFFEEMGLSLERGQPVKLSGFGNFSLRDKAARPGRNPRTGESVPIKKRRVVTFRAGQKLRSKVESYGKSNSKR